MKRLIVIIIILAIIFLGMIAYKNVMIKTNTISVQEIEKIESYINQIYMWKEVTGEALPYFEEINQADERWIWEVIKKNLEEEKLSKEQIQEKGKELFGQDFAKEFPKEGNESFSYIEEVNLEGENQYEAIEVELDQQGDLFLLNKIDKIKDGYEIEIVEYLEDYSPMLKEEPENFIVIRNEKEEEIGKISGSAEEEERELVKRNIDRFNKKRIQLKVENEKLYLKKVYQ